MHRLALAIAAALSLHILLLMIVVPEPQVRKPEIKGSGQVTVSIIHSIPEIEPFEKAKEQNLPEITEVADQINQDDPEEASSELPREEKSPEQETKEEKVQVKEPVKRFDRSRATKELTGDNTKEQKKVEPVESETSPFSSAIETLQDPRPIEQLNRPPEYPALARKRGWEGTVILEVDIRSDGMVKDVQIQKSSSFIILDNEALRAVRKWHFQPGTTGGMSVDMKVLVPVHFLLKEE